MTNEKMREAFEVDWPNLKMPSDVMGGEQADRHAFAIYKAGYLASLTQQPEREPALVLHAYHSRDSGALLFNVIRHTGLEEGTHALYVGPQPTPQVPEGLIEAIRPAFITGISGGTPRRYWVVMKFETPQQMQSAHDALSRALAAPYTTEKDHE